MGTFLTVVLTIIIIFYFVGIIGKFVLRLWLSKKMKKFQQNQGGATESKFYGFGSEFQQNSRKTEKPKKNGEVTIDIDNSQNRNIDKKIGEYVEFDEIKE